MKPSVNKERIRKLADALRSDRYEQATGFLRAAGLGITTKPHMCVLGVACDVSGVGEWGEVMLSTGGWKFRPYLVPGESYQWTKLPSAVMRWYGFASRVPRVTVDGYPRPLSELNDEGYTFDQLADLIEKEYL